MQVRVAVVVNHIRGVQLPILVLHQQAEVIRYGFFDPDGVVLVNDAERVQVAVITTLETELEPHPELRQDAVLPVAGANQDLCGSATLLPQFFAQHSFVVQPKFRY